MNGTAADDDEFRVVGVRRVPPNPGVMKAIGLHHSLESAVADLVDNGVDAKASIVLIRFVLKSGRVDRVMVVDDGHGMGEQEIDDAMQLGRPKEAREALGHFGVGLKSASFSQAASLTVLSRRRSGAAQGRRMMREGRGAGFECEVLDPAAVESMLDQPWPGFSTKRGTMILWDGLRTFPESSDPAVTTAYVERKQSDLRHHLGLIFHRLLKGGRVRIALDVFDADEVESGFVFFVDPIDPFAYTRTGAAGFPKTMTAQFRETSVPMHCHIWPGGSDSHYFKLAGSSTEQLQGFYIYRNDRLLSAGGWGGVTVETRARKLARACIDIEDHLGGFTMTMEKAGVRMVADLVRAIESAYSQDGTTFAEYLGAAENVFKQANKRVRKRTPVLPPGKGLAPRVKKALARELEFVSGEEPVDIRWQTLSHWGFVEVDRNNRVLLLNARYREAVLLGKTAGANDAPLIKTLLFLLYEDIFRGMAFGAKDKDNVALWDEILTAAADAEYRRFHGE